MRSLICYRGWCLWGLFWALEGAALTLCTARVGPLFEGFHLQVIVNAGHRLW